MSQAGPPPQAPIAPADNTERTLAMLCHLLGLVGFLGPLILWLLKKDQYPLVDDQGKESLNFQITILLAAVICVPLAFAVVGCFLLPALTAADLIFIIIATVKTNSGETYRYPFALRLIK